MDQSTVKRNIVSIRIAFQRTVEFGRKVVLESESPLRQQVAQEILFESLGPLNKRERRIVRDALVNAAMDRSNDFTGHADKLVVTLLKAA
jgi:hypothetical protein